MNALRPEQQQPEIQRELARLQQTVEDLSTVHLQLIEKLGPVITKNELPQRAMAVGESEARTPLGKYVGTIELNVRTEIERVRSLIDSIGF